MVKRNSVNPIEKGEIAHFRLQPFPKHAMDLNQPHPWWERSKSNVLTERAAGERVPCAGDAIYRDSLPDERTLSDGFWGPEE
jgi:hypothetical protein